MPNPQTQAVSAAQAWRHVALAGAICLAACTTVGPNYEAPVPKAPAQWSVVAPSAAPGADSIARWWEQFGDATLNELIRSALADSPDLRQTRAKLEAARIQRDLANAQSAPTIAAGVQASRGRTSDATTASYQPSLSASLPVDLFGGLARGSEAAQADLEASAATLGAARATLAAQVATGYVNLRSLQQRIAIAQANLASQTETWQITGWRLRAGLTTSLDEQQARSSLEQTRAQIPALQASLAQARHALSVLAGRDPAALDPEFAQAVPVPRFDAALAVPLPAAALAQRPDVAAAERALAAATARVGIAEAARYPGINLSGSAALSAPTLAALGQGHAFAGTVVANLAVTLFDADRLRLQVRAQDAAQRQALAAYEKTVLDALREVEDALAAIAAQRARREAWTAVVEAARNAALMASSNYRSGLKDFQSVLDAERTLRSAEDTRASAEADEANAIVALYAALGGGWRPEDIAQDIRQATPGEQR